MKPTLPGTKSTPARFCVCLAAVISLLAPAAFPASGAGAQRGGDAQKACLVLRDEWHVVRLVGARVGHQHMVVTRLPGSEGLIRTLVSTVMDLTRASRHLAVRDDTVFVETAEGRVVRVKHVHCSSKQPIYTDGEVRDGKLHLRVRSAGFSQEKKLAWGPDILGPMAQDRLSRKMCAQPNAAFSFKVFLPQFLRTTVVHVKLQGKERITFRGRPVLAGRAVVTQKILPGVTTILWFDEKGDMLRSVSVMLGLPFETVRATKEEALKKTGGAKLDLFTTLFVVSKARLDKPQAIHEALYRISAAGLGKTGLELGGFRQKVEKRKGDAIWLRVTARRGGFKTRRKSSGDMAEYLGPNQYVQAADPAIVSAARSGLGLGPGVDPAAALAGRSAKERWRAAKQLERWVHRHIRAKHLGVGFASAREVLDRREGDCTEHAVLLAALLRAAGIPARAAVGLMYWHGVFGYHMWTEVHVGGWRSLDATIAGPFVDATHITLSNTSLAPESLAQPTAQLAGLPANLKIDIIEYVMGNRTVVVRKSEE